MTDDKQSTIEIKATYSKGPTSWDPEKPVTFILRNRRSWWENFLLDLKEHARMLAKVLAVLVFLGAWLSLVTPIKAATIFPVIFAGYIAFLGTTLILIFFDSLNWKDFL